MTKIVAISDLHLGQTGMDGRGQYSLLSTRATPNLVAAFTAAVARFAGSDPVTIVVAGDFVDLSLAYAADALADLRGLIADLKSSVAIDEIVYVVGNHDHHLWSLHSEDQRLLEPLRAGRVPPMAVDDDAKAIYHVTSRDAEPFRLLQPTIDAIDPSTPTKISVAYPSCTRQLDDGTLLYVTHGHLFGGLYTDLSDLLKSKLRGKPHDRVAATVNHPLIELIYWHIGEIGEALGADGLVEAIYTDLQKGKDARVRALVSKIVADLLPHGILWRVLGGLERRIVVDAIMRVLDKALLSPQLNTVTAADRFADVEATRAGLVAWLRALELPVFDNPEGTIVLQGHTHVRDEYAIPDTRVRTYNLGTWLVEPNHDAPKTGFLAIDGSDTHWIDVA